MAATSLSFSVTAGSTRPHTLKVVLSGDDDLARPRSQRAQCPLPSLEGGDGLHLPVGAVPTGIPNTLKRTAAIGAAAVAQSSTVEAVSARTGPRDARHARSPKTPLTGRHRDIYGSRETGRRGSNDERPGELENGNGRLRIPTFPVEDQSSQRSVLKIPLSSQSRTNSESSPAGPLRRRPRETRKTESVPAGATVPEAGHTRTAEHQARANPVPGRAEHRKG